MADEIVLPVEPANLLLIRIGPHWAYVSLGETVEEALQNLGMVGWPEYGSKLRHAIIHARSEQLDKPSV